VQGGPEPATGAVGKPQSMEQTQIGPIPGGWVHHEQEPQRPQPEERLDGDLADSCTGPSRERPLLHFSGFYASDRTRSRRFPHAGEYSPCAARSDRYSGRMLNLFRRRLLLTTETELIAIANAAMTGLIIRPENGYRTPAAMGIPITL
jgi:hypothetical protein